MLYKPFIPPPIEQQVDENGRPAPIIPCDVCNGRGYFGRIAIFELLTPGDKVASRSHENPGHGKTDAVR